MLQTSHLAAGERDSPSDPGLGEEGRDQDGGPRGSAGGAPRRVGVLGGTATGHRHTEERGNRRQPQRPAATEPPRALSAKGEEVGWFPSAGVLLTDCTRSQLRARGPAVHGTWHGPALKDSGEPARCPKKGEAVRAVGSTGPSSGA